MKEAEMNAQIELYSVARHNPYFILLLVIVEKAQFLYK